VANDRGPGATKRQFAAWQLGVYVTVLGIGAFQDLCWDEVEERECGWPDYRCSGALGRGPVTAEADLSCLREWR